ncbi:MAG: hypothetical protein J2P17_24295 [Mycobacterium sp.]|nr:hypothetical protein [Mycobacterium sp.]
MTLPSSHPSAALGAGPQMVDQRIDHIDGVHLASDAVDGTYPSDHRAVVADLRWGG